MCFDVCVLFYVMTGRLYSQVYRYSVFFFNRHAVAFNKRSVFKEISISRFLYNNKKKIQKWVVSYYAS